MTVRFRDCACGAQVVGVPAYDGGKPFILDRSPDDAGDVFIFQRPNGRWAASDTDTGPTAGVRMRRHVCRPEPEMPGEAPRRPVERLQADPGTSTAPGSAGAL